MTGRRPGAAAPALAPGPKRLAVRPPRAYLVCLAALGAALLGHAWYYRFLTDDAFISFRYARNFSQGHGLVFNPGFERVEGYSNFLWVILQAALDRVGIAPETSAIPLSLLLTAGLFAGVAIYGWRQLRERDPWWIALVAPGLLAATRSFAVWSSSGLETRCFEFLAVLAVLRLHEEVAPRDPAAQPRRISAWLFALACLTRPDGLLIAAAANGAALLMLSRKGLAQARGLLLSQWPLVVTVGAHTAFRLAYYGDWLPNTYYAKVGGRTWWDAGGLYLLAFALEYAAWLWLPLVAAGVVWRLRGRMPLGPALFGAVIVPHAVYVASIGGDHFEFRPLDLYFPFLYLLVADGIASVARVRAGRALAPAAAIVVLAGVWTLPWRAHLEFPNRYVSGFPGMEERTEGRDTFLDPDRDPVYRLPGLRLFALAHRDALRRLTSRFVGVRQEEHRLFFDTSRATGIRLRELVKDGRLPADLYLATLCVGAIPYYSGLRTLDVLGLTDRTVAHSAGSKERMMAHDKHATEEYIRSRGVDISGLNLFFTTISAKMTLRIQYASLAPDLSGVARLSDDEWMICDLPQGVEAANRRMSKLHFRRFDDPDLVRFLEPAILPGLRQAFQQKPSFPNARELALGLLVFGHYKEAIPYYQGLAERIPTQPANWENLAMCHLGMHDLAGALLAMRQAARVAHEAGDSLRASRLEKRCSTIAASM